MTANASPGSPNKMRGPGRRFGQWKATRLRKTYITATEWRRPRAVSHVVGFVEYRQVVVAESYYPFRSILQFRIQTVCSGRRWYNFVTHAIKSPYGDEEIHVLLEDQSNRRELTDKPTSRVCERCRKWATNHARYLLADI